MTVSYGPSESVRSMIAAAGVVALVLGLVPLAPSAQAIPPGQRGPDGQATTAQADSPIEFERQAGPTRFETAAEIATARFDASTNVVIATGEDFADALAGSGLEGSLEAPVLLVPTDLVGGSIPNAITDAIDELGATSATLLGGTDAIATAVENHIVDNSTVATTDRVAGATRFETAEEIANEVSARPLPTALADELGLAGDTAFLATGLEFADALAAGSGAYAGPHPILLTPTDELHSAAERGLQASGADSVIILGGTDAVSSSVESSLNSAGFETERLAGVDRWETATEVADAFADGFGFGVADVGLATGFKFADALASAPYLGELPAPVLLTPSGSVNDQPESWFAERGCAIETLHVFGGEDALPQGVADSYAETACQEEQPGDPETLELTPQSATNPVSTDDTVRSHEVSAAVADADANSLEGVDVRFEVYDDNEARDASSLEATGDAAVVSTDVDGEATWSYDGPDSERSDVIVACTPDAASDSCTDGSDLLRDSATGEFTNLQNEPLATAEKAWVTSELETLQIDPETDTNFVDDTPHTVTVTGVDQFGETIDLEDTTDGDADTDRVMFEVFRATETDGTTEIDQVEESLEDVSDGDATFSYPSDEVGEDTIVACRADGDEAAGDVDCAQLDDGDVTVNEDRLNAVGEKSWVELTNSATFDLSWENEVGSFGAVDDVAADAGSNAQVTLSWNTELGFIETDGTANVTSPIPADGSPAGTNFHLHEGALEENGDVVISFETPEFVQDADGETDPDAVDFDERQAFFDYDLSGSVQSDDHVSILEDFDAAVEDAEGDDEQTPRAAYYVNVHTEANAAGEIRGQALDGGQADLPPLFKATASDGLQTADYNGDGERTTLQRGLLEFNEEVQGDTDILSEVVSGEDFTVTIDGDEVRVLTGDDINEEFAPEDEADEWRGGATRNPNTDQFLYFAEFTEEDGVVDGVAPTAFFSEGDEVSVIIEDGAAELIVDAEEEDTAEESVRTRSFTAQEDEGLLELRAADGDPGTQEVTVTYNLDVDVPDDDAAAAQFFLIEGDSAENFDRNDESTFAARGDDGQGLTDVGEPDQLEIPFDFSDGDQGGDALEDEQTYTVAYREATDEALRIVSTDEGFEAESPDSVSFNTAVVEVAITQVESITAANETDHTVAGTGEPGAAVDVVWEDENGDTVEGAADVDGNGDWSLSEDVSSLADGSVDITATQDRDGSTDSVVAIKDTAGFESVSAGDILLATTGQSQTFEFTPADRAVEDGETVTIDLDDPATDVDYSGADFATTTGSGSADYDDSENDLVYEAGAGGDAAGTTVTITATGVDASGADAGTDYAVSFIRDATDATAEDTFTVQP